MGTAVTITPNPAGLTPQNRTALAIVLGGLLASAGVCLFSESNHPEFFKSAFSEVPILLPPYVILALWSRHKLAVAKDLQDEKWKAASAFTAIVGTSLPFVLARWMGHSVGEGLILGVWWLLFIAFTPLTIYLARKAEPILSAICIRCLRRTRDQPFLIFIVMLTINSIVFAAVQIGIIIAAAPFALRLFFFASRWWVTL